jgi:hypothetical protein
LYCTQSDFENCNAHSNGNLCELLPYNFILTSVYKDILVSPLSTHHSLILSTATVLLFLTYRVRSKHFECIHFLVVYSHHTPYNASRYLHGLIYSLKIYSWKLILLHNIMMPGRNVKHTSMTWCDIIATFILHFPHCLNIAFG